MDVAHEGKPSFLTRLSATGKCTPRESLICPKETLQGILRGRVDPDSVIHSDGWRGCDGLMLSAEQLERIKPFLPRSHGIPRVDDRKVISGIIYITRTQAHYSR